jgi:predicted small secreted protein
MKRIAILLLMAWAVSLTGCNTMKGLGKDMEKAGEAIQKKADR